MHEGPSGSLGRSRHVQHGRKNAKGETPVSILENRDIGFEIGRKINSIEGGHARLSNLYEKLNDTKARALAALRKNDKIEVPATLLFKKYFNCRFW